MFSDPGDWIGGGSQRVFRTGDSPITMGGSPGFAIDGIDGSWWYADFVPAPGDILARGTHLNATRYPFTTATAPAWTFPGTAAAATR
jgi:hypothetical protein